MSAQSGANEPREQQYTFDPDSPEYIKDLQRPAVIKEDLTEMERRKRVQQILESKSFLKELEEVIRYESRAANDDAEQMQMVQRLSELTIPNGHPMSFASVHSLAGTPIQICDMKADETCSKLEKMYRNKMASLFRLVDLFQWSQGINNHITLRLPGDEDELLVNPFGLLYHEITASSLVKVNSSGEIIQKGATKFGVNKSGFVLHAAIHLARPDVKCVMYLHTGVVSAVASMKCGLLPLCQEAMVIGPVAYHDYKECASEKDEMERIVDGLGSNKVMLLRNLGFVVCGSSVEETLHLAFHTVIACETQIRAVKGGMENIVIPNEETVKKAYEASRRKDEDNTRTDNSNGEVTWRVGELEWEAWMRVLDHAGFRTGQQYKQPQPRPKSQMSQSMYVTSDVAAPPSASSVGSLDESDPAAVFAHKLALLRREQDKSRWLNSPNAYQKVEILETGTDCPKRITKWVQDATSLSANGTPVKISSPHQFSPMSANPKEFKDKQKKIKECRRAGYTTAGPTSQILDGTTYEDLSHMKPDVEGLIGQSDRSVLIGTASKGIIDRQHQHNAQVYRQLYAPNPFAVETDDEIKKYIYEVEQKSPKSRTPCSSARDTRIESCSPFEEDPGADTASLMQGVRDHIRSSATRSSVSMDDMGVPDLPLELAPNVTSPRDVSSTLDSSRTEGNQYLYESDLCGGHESPQATSTPKDGKTFVRSKSHSSAARRLFGSGNTSARSDVTMSEDESGRLDCKKKKKRGLFSVFKKKDKSSAPS